MASEDTNQLIEAWLDGVIDDVGVAELEVAILESAQVRREFWRRATLHGMLREAAKVAFADSGIESVPPQPDSPAGDSGPAPGFRRGWLRGSVAAGMAVLLISGCGIGSAVTSLAFAYSGWLGRGLAAFVVHEEGFERPPAPEQRYLPDRLDIWSGDETTVVGGEHGILPRSGGRMLKFLSPRPQGAVYPGLASEIWRVIDLESLRAAAGSRDVRIDFSACFNGCNSGGTSRRCWISAIATDVHPQALGDDWAEQFNAAEERPAAVASAQARELLDADPATWQRFSVTITSPPGARYVLLHCLTDYRADEDANVAERCGQYVDDISVAVTPAEPAIVEGAAHHREARR